MSVPYQYKTYKRSDKVIPENDGTLRFVPHDYKNQKMFNKAVDNYAHALEFPPSVIRLFILILLQYNLFLNATSQKTCDKVVDTCPFVFDSVPD